MQQSNKLDHMPDVINQLSIEMIIGFHVDSFKRSVQISCRKIEEILSVGLNDMVLAFIKSVKRINLTVVSYQH